MLGLTISNFRNLQNVELVDEGKFSIFMGYNEAGKSSLLNAIKFAFTGEAFGHKGKNLDPLITRGQARMSVRAQVNDVLACRTGHGVGDKIGDIAKALNVPEGVLPLLFDAEMTGDGGNKHMKAFLNGIGGDNFDPVAALAHEPRLQECVTAAKRASKLQVKAIVAFCEEQRAKQKPPPSPVQPPTPGLSAEKIASLKSQVATLDSKITALRSDEAETVRIGQDISGILMYLDSQEKYEAAAAAYQGDKYAGCRKGHQRIAAISIPSLTAVSDILSAVPGFDDLGNKFYNIVREVDKAAQEAAEFLQKNPAPPSSPVPPPVNPKLAEYQTLLGNTTGKEFLTAVQALCAEMSTAADGLRKQLAPLVTERTALATELDAGLRSMGAWENYVASMASYKSSCDASIVAWNMWDRAAKELTRLHTDYMSKQGVAFSSMVSSLGQNVLQGRRLNVDPDVGITLDGQSITDVSKSTRWRMEVCVMAAIAQSLGSPLLLLDGADILDVRNRGRLIDFLMTNIVPNFKHVVLAATPVDEISKITPIGLPGVNRWVVEDGVVRKVG